MKLRIKIIEFKILLRVEDIMVSTTAHAKRVCSSIINILRKISTTIRKFY
jgi:hypothetical protein